MCKHRQNEQLLSTQRKAFLLSFIGWLQKETLGQKKSLNGTSRLAVGPDI